MEKFKTHNKVWELLVSHKDELLTQWKSIRFDQVVILQNGEHHDTMGRVLTTLVSKLWVYKGLNDPSIGGYTGYWVSIDVDSPGLECSLVSDYHDKWGSDEGGPMILKLHNIHENNPHILDDDIVAKEAVDLVLKWLNEI